MRGCIRISILVLSLLAVWGCGEDSAGGTDGSNVVGPRCEAITDDCGKEGYQCVETLHSYWVCTTLCASNEDCEYGHCWSGGTAGHCTYPDDPAHGIGIDCEKTDDCFGELVCLAFDARRDQCEKPCVVDDDCDYNPNARCTAHESGVLRCKVGN